MEAHNNFRDFLGSKKALHLTLSDASTVSLNSRLSIRKSLENKKIMQTVCLFFMFLDGLERFLCAYRSVQNASVPTVHWPMSISSSNAVDSMNVPEMTPNRSEIRTREVL